MHLHILGICGTFMGGLALLARQAGFTVTGSDSHCYPPMSTQLQEQGIELFEGYHPNHIPSTVDLVLVGNVIKRGNDALESVMAKGIPYTSGPEWLTRTILNNRTVISVAGTHGKTTTTSLLTWILEQANLSPGFLIGGVAQNFGVSARLGARPYFVIEADEYDSAFFDKRPKFIHYRSNTIILNNLEYDHADIYPNLEAIKQQFHYLVRTIPNNGLIVYNQSDANLRCVLQQGVYTPVSSFVKGDWEAQLVQADGSQFRVIKQGQVFGEVNWSLLGQHNVANALAAIAVASHFNVPAETIIAALASFKNVKRRLELKAVIDNIAVYDDFAHHPTAIATTLAGLRAKIGPDKRIVAVLEFGSYTMRTGVHKNSIKQALCDANLIMCKQPEVDWGLQAALASCEQAVTLHDTVDALLADLIPKLRSGDHLVVMSNSGFDNIHPKLLKQLRGGVHDASSS